MGEDNRRLAVRVDCDLPIRLGGLDSDLTARIVDISRTGLRMRVRGEALGVHRLSSLVQVTRSLQELLGDSFTGELHYEMLGPLVGRTLSPSRIAKRDWEHTDVEVGCSFDRPLSDEECGMLGVALPSVGAESAPPRLSPVGPVRRTAGTSPRPHLRRLEPDQHLAYVYPAPGKFSKPLLTRAISVSRGTALLSVDPGQGWELPEVAVTDLVMAIDAAYGTSIMLRIVDGDDDLWAGPAEIQELDVAPDAEAIKLGVAFRRELRTEELGRLGLPTPA